MDIEPKTCKHGELIVNCSACVEIEDLRTENAHLQSVIDETNAQKSADRDTIINALLSIGNMSEGIIADAIISAIVAKQSPAVAVPDNCEACKGQKGGVRGNENVINGIRVCDYCSVDESYKTYSPSQRVTEQDAREIVEAAICEMMISGILDLDKWMNEEGRALLNKLNAKGDSNANS